MTWRRAKIGLLVTGELEEVGLPKLLRSISSAGTCYPVFLRRFGQRAPRKAEAKLTPPGQKKRLPTKDEVQIGLPARKFLSEHVDNYVVLVDDIEYDITQQGLEQAKFDRYRLVLDELLGANKDRAAVHFLRNMIEAYYFADPDSVQRSTGLILDLAELLPESGTFDCESIRHPKNEVKRQHARKKLTFDALEDGEKICACIDLERVLDDKKTCATLRSLVAWCLDAAGAPRTARYQLAEGALDPLTSKQTPQNLKTPHP